LVIYRKTDAALVSFRLSSFYDCRRKRTVTVTHASRWEFTSISSENQQLKAVENRPARNEQFAVI
jgi:hypothetical protein